MSSDCPASFARRIIAGRGLYSATCLLRKQHVRHRTSAEPDVSPRRSRHRARRTRARHVAFLPPDHRAAVSVAHDRLRPELRAVGYAHVGVLRGLRHRPGRRGIPGGSSGRTARPARRARAVRCRRPRVRGRTELSDADGRRGPHGPGQQRVPSRGFHAAQSARERAPTGARVQRARHRRNARLGSCTGVPDRTRQHRGMARRTDRRRRARLRRARDADRESCRTAVAHGARSHRRAHGSKQCREHRLPATACRLDVFRLLLHHRDGARRRAELHAAGAARSLRRRRSRSPH